MLSDDLVSGGGDFYFDAGLCAVLDVDAGEPRGGSAGMVARAVSVSVGFEMREAGEDIELALHFFERQEVLRQLEIRTYGRGLPISPYDTVRDVDESYA